MELLGECPGRNDSTKCSRRHALCCDIYDAIKKMDVTNAKMPTYVVDHVGIGRIPKYSPDRGTQCCCDGPTHPGP